MELGGGGAGLAPQELDVCMGRKESESYIGNGVR